MLQVNLIRESREKVTEGLKKRNLEGVEQLIAEVVALDQERKSKQAGRDEANAEVNASSAKVGELMKQGKKDDAEKIRTQVAGKKEKIKALEEEVRQVEEKLTQLLYKIPNVPAEKVPAGRSAESNMVVHQHGTPPKLPAGSQPHWDLIKKYDI